MLTCIFKRNQSLKIWIYPRGFSILRFSNKNNNLDKYTKNWIIVESVEVANVIRKIFLFADEEQDYNNLFVIR